VFIFAVFLSPRIFTLALFISITVLLSWINYKGMSTENALRRARCWIIGPYRTARGYESIRYPIDFKWESRLKNVWNDLEGNSIRDRRQNRMFGNVRWMMTLRRPDFLSIARICMKMSKPL